MVDLEKVNRIALAVAPKSRGSFREQARETLNTIGAVVTRQAMPMDVTIQTVFLKRAADEAECRRLFSEHYGNRMPATNYIVQPLCCGAALAVEAWMVGGHSTEVYFHGPNVVSIAYDGLRWIHCAGISPPAEAKTAYPQSEFVFGRMNGLLREAGARFSEVVRTWIYIGGITAKESGTERYRELNRARTDFFEHISFGGKLALPGCKGDFYPASTGIGAGGRGLVTSCLALQTDRDDVRILPLENPLQTPSFDYGTEYSLKSPKFSRAMAVVVGNYLTTWVSGTASIVDSETVYPGDIEGQTEQTITNIERLIARENFARQGLAGAGATLDDLAKVRVYIKRQEDYAKCRAVCERLLGDLPATYALADVCRPDLLVEIEGVAFSSVKKAI
ncbi:MAG: Rid family hydrolase [Verrucomicrobiales bacterium]